MPMVTASMRLCAVRGATTAAANKPECVSGAVRELVAALTQANAIEPEDVVSAIFSATPDVRCLYPAAIARGMGWQDVPMLCVTEMDVAGAPRLCVRVLLHLAVPSTRTLRPVYLRGACVLRPDLVEAAEPGLVRA